MRLLQLVTGPGELIDLHPNVTVVAGLDADDRRHLEEAVTSIARGRAPDRVGLLEAHGVLFDLSDEMLRLLDLGAVDLQPVVRPGDLPTRKTASPLGSELERQQQALAVAVDRSTAAAAADARAREALAEAAAALDEARRSRGAAESDAARRAESIEALRAQVDQAIDRRQQLEGALDGLRPRLAAASARREAVDAATADVREAKQAAMARAADLAAALDRATLALDPSGASDAASARTALAEIEAAVEHERQVEAQDGDRRSERPSLPELEARRAEVVARREAVDKALIAFGPSAIEEVEAALAAARTEPLTELVASQDALALAEELEALEAGLDDWDDEGPGIGLAESQARLDAAREALLQAEHAVRIPAPDRGLIDRLELAHADLLDAIDKADGRFGGARAERKVEERRAAELAILDEMGFTTYSDYMMGNSLLHVDPVKEWELDTARAEMIAAEDAWRLAQQRTYDELARAAELDRRRTLLERARDLLGHPVAAAGVVEQLRAHRVKSTVVVDHRLPLRHSLEVGGLALGDESLGLGDLIVMGEAWLHQAHEAASREAATLEEARSLDDELAELTAAIAEERALLEGPPPLDPEIERAARLTEAREALAAAEARRQGHEAAQDEIQALSTALADASDEERAAIEVAGGAEEAIASAVATEAPLLAEVRRVEEELAVVARAEADANDELKTLSAPDGPYTSGGQAPAVEEAEQALARWTAEVEKTAAAVAALDVERRAAVEAVEALRSSGAEIGGEGLGVSIKEEVEWYLLARLAAQRSVSLAGSLPLLLDDVFAELDEPELQHVLDRLERMAEAVQVIIVSEDPAVVKWALSAGEDRAAVARPGPGDAGGSLSA